MTNAQDFRNVAENAGAEDIFEDGSQEFRMNEDDGTLHVEQFGLRACFYIGQGNTRISFNRQANQVLKTMGYRIRYEGQGIV